jgi:uncharacterized damage-inducible protein DinB
MPTAEKDQFIQNWEREFQTTMKVLKSYPENKLDLKPHEKSRSAKELAWTLNMEEKVLINGAISGKFDFANAPPPPSTLQEILTIYERNHKENVERVKKMSEQDMNKTVQFMSGPNKMSDMRTADVLWTGIMDTVHQRGQFSVYLRMAGGKVPSIYGPSADEPWM